MPEDNQINPHRIAVNADFYSSITGGDSSFDFAAKEIDYSGSEEESLDLLLADTENNSFRLKDISIGNEWEEFSTVRPRSQVRERVDHLNAEGKWTGIYSFETVHQLYEEPWIDGNYFMQEERSQRQLDDLDHLLESVLGYGLTEFKDRYQQADLRQV